MVVVNRMSNVVSDVLRNRSEPNQPEPSKLYAQAKEAAKDVKKPAKTPEQQLKECLDKCGSKPKYKRQSDAYDPEKKKAFLKKTQVWLECRQKCKGVKPKPEPRLEPPKLTPEDCAKQWKVLRRGECVPCPPRKVFDPASRSCKLKSRGRRKVINPLE